MRGSRAWLIAAAASLLGAASPCLAGDAAPSAYPAGEEAFHANCMVCHGPNGAGQPSLAPPLITYPARYASIAEGRRQLAMTVLNGMFGAIDVDGKHFDFKMPQFDQLDDATLAAVLNFVVFDLGHAPKDTKPLTAAEIAAERSKPQDGTAVRQHRASVLALLGL
jgi:mono/diheme cytochrome c family protein